MDILKLGRIPLLSWPSVPAKTPLLHSDWARLTSSEPATSVRSCAVCSCFRRPRKSMWACMAAKPSAATSMAGLDSGCTPALEQMRSACLASLAAVLSRALAAPRKARTACKSGMLNTVGCSGGQAAFLSSGQSPAFCAPQAHCLQCKLRCSARDVLVGVSTVIQAW